ncbi:helix-turn-helix domain-containing protein [Streptomyces sedi]|uniref:Helix-turn-helix transcriptional regulator n=1 Tax=Streptomyces sedi TaxID=555059 RepID=A0A5C4UQ95_9ACTN|nr:AraC family transcriptional regulator [Streptomyces sedi]TNM25780.1 helix-turn-helix transcriptional regulator [Streptomyces sedi]
MTARLDGFFWQELVLEKEIPESGEDGWIYQLPDGAFGIITPLQSSCQVSGMDGRGRRSATLMPGEICRVAPNNPVRLDRTPPRRPAFRVACIQLPLTILQRTLEAHPESSIRTVAELHTLRAFDPHIASMAPVLLHAWRTGNGDQYAIAAAHYLAEYLLQPFRTASPGAGGLNAEQLFTVRTYMETHLSENITLDRLAKEVRLSRYHFLRRFSVATGKTPLQYLTGLRVDAARHLLVSGGDPISHVGRLCGFVTPENFARVFRKHVGCSPSEYRQRGRRATPP